MYRASNKLSEEAQAWPQRNAAEAGIDEGRLFTLLEFARENESQLTWGDDVPSGKARFLRDAFGSDADVEMVGPFAPKGRLNGIVIRRGYIIAEFGDTSYVDEIASATKSFLSTLAGVAVGRGLIKSPHASVFGDTGLELLDTPHNRLITWHHLLQ